MSVREKGFSLVEMFVAISVLGILTAKHDGGFTLIEVLVAISIMALVLAENRNRLNQLNNERHKLIENARRADPG